MGAPEITVEFSITGAHGRHVAYGFRVLAELSHLGIYPGNHACGLQVSHPHPAWWRVPPGGPGAKKKGPSASLSALGTADSCHAGLKS